MKKSAAATTAQKQLAKIRELMANRPSPYEGMTKDEAIEEMRKIREQIWEEKFATRDHCPRRDSVVN